MPKRKQASQPAPGLVIPPPELRAALAERMGEVGAAGLSRQLNLPRESVVAVAQGRAVRRGTLMVVDAQARAMGVLTSSSSGAQA